MLVPREAGKSGLGHFVEGGLGERPAKSAGYAQHWLAQSAAKKTEPGDAANSIQQQMRSLFRQFGILGTVAFAASCSKSPDASAPKSEPLAVFCAANLVKPVTEIAAQYEEGNT